MCSEAIAGDLRALRSLIKLSNSEAVSGSTRCLTPGPRPDQRSVAAAPMAGRSIPVWCIRVEPAPQTHVLRGRRLRPAPTAPSRRSHFAVPLCDWQQPKMITHSARKNRMRRAGRLTPRTSCTPSACLKPDESARGEHAVPASGGSDGPDHHIHTVRRSSLYRPP